jgi:hypothetical protein
VLHRLKKNHNLICISLWLSFIGKNENNRN